MTIDPNAERPLEVPTDERTPDPTEADTIRRQNADELWNRSLRYNGRP